MIERVAEQDVRGAIGGDAHPLVSGQRERPFPGLVGLQAVGDARDVGFVAVQRLRHLAHRQRALRVQAAERMGLEGIVSKRASSTYQSGRSSAWLKVKCMTDGEFVVIGTGKVDGGPPFALLAREETGAGQHIDVSMSAAANVTTEMATYGWLMAGAEMQRQTGRHADPIPRSGNQLEL